MRKDKLQPIYDLLPEGWKEAAHTEGALQRGRNITTPEELLRLNFLYQTSGESYGLTAALVQISENQKNLNKTAVQYRIVHSRNWLRWLCENLSRQEGFLVEPPSWLSPYRVCVVDATNYAKLGSNQIDFRLHYMTELFTLNATEFHFTEDSQGETLTIYENIRENDLILGDRIYGTIKSMSHVLERKAHFVLRLKADSFNLYREDGTKFDITAYLAEHKGKNPFDFNLFFKEGKNFIPLRICILPKSEEDIKKSQQQIKRANSGKNRGKLTDLQKVWSRYVVLATSLPATIATERVTELYRMRWQVELVFKRFKSIFGGGKFASKKKESVEAWFYGKLLVAILCETLVKKGRFPPTEDKKPL